MKKSRILISITLAILAIQVAPVATASPLDTWTWRNPLPTGNLLSGVVYGNGQYVAVGYNSTILTSPDGLNWTQQTAPTNITLTGIAFNGSTFVAVGLDAKTTDAAVLTSSDGINWLATDGSLGVHGLLAVTVGAGQFVTVGYSGTAFTSSDGTNWASHALGVGNSLNGVAYGGGLFVAVGSSGGIFSSSDGMSWTSRISGTPYALNGVAYGNGTFSVVGESVFLSSFNGIAWSVILTGQFAVAITYNPNDNLFVAWDNGHQPALFISSNALNWKVNGPATAGTTSLFNALTYNNTTFVAVGSGGNIAYSTSPQGTNWMTVNSSVTADQMSAVAYGINYPYGYGIFVAVGGMLGDTSGTIVYSYNGTNWFLDTSSPNALAWTTVSGITYGQDPLGNPIFVAVGTWYAGSENGAILTSQDGVNWGTNNNVAAITPYVSLNAVAFAGYNPGHYPPFVAVGSSGTILTSMDATNWAAQTSVGFNNLYGVAFGGGSFVAVSDSAIYTSLDATNWSSVSLPSGRTLRGVTYANGQFFAVGSTSYSADYAILSSPDGTSWSYADGPNAGSPLTGITFNNGTFVAVGGAGEILTSPDGSTWTSRASGAGAALNTVTFGDNQFITLGASGTILGSVQPLLPPVFQFSPVIQFNSKGAALLILTGPPGASVTILSGSSPNSLSTMTTYTIPQNGILPFSDTSAPNSPVKFYQAKIGL